MKFLLGVASAVISIICLSHTSYYTGPRTGPPLHYEEAKTMRTAVDGEETIGTDTQGVPYLEPPFGYHKTRNTKKWRFIYNSIKADKNKPGTPLTLIDYGADEGYFSISAASAFPDMRVMGLEMGGKGGSIRKKDHDVLLVQEAKAKAYDVGDRFTMCQTTAKQEHFFALAKRGTGHDYQFVLSVFHWFTMKTRKEFEQVLIALFRNAKTTFIELPIAGDLSARFKEQIGAKYFFKWYDGRTNIQQIIQDSLKAQRVKGKVTKLGGVKWLQGDKKNPRGWDREVFRVDMEEDPDDFDCEAHFEIYGCAASTTPVPVEFSRCPN